MCAYFCTCVSVTRARAGRDRTALLCDGVMCVPIFCMCVLGELEWDFLGIESALLCDGGLSVCLFLCLLQELCYSGLLTVPGLWAHAGELP